MGYLILIGVAIFVVLFMFHGLRRAQQEARDSNLVGASVSFLLLLVIPVLTNLGILWLAGLFLPIEYYRANTRDPISLLVFCVIGLLGCGLAFLIVPRIIDRFVYGNRPSIIREGVGGQAVGGGQKMSINRTSEDLSRESDATFHARLRRINDYKFSPKPAEELNEVQAVTNKDAAG